MTKNIISTDFGEVRIQKKTLVSYTGCTSFSEVSNTKKGNKHLDDLLRDASAIARYYWMLGKEWDRRL